MGPRCRNLVFIFLLLPATMHAAPDAPAASSSAAASSPYNMALLGLMGIVLVLMLAIGILGGVMKTLAHMHMDKIKKEREEGTIAKAAVMLLVFCLLGFTAGAEEAAEAVVAAPPSPFVSGIPRGQFNFLMGLIGFEIIVILGQVWMIQGLLKALRPQAVKAPAELTVRKKNFLDVFNRSVSVEREEGILLDHDYDGIKELDNSLPPWWKWGFVLTILVSVVYMWYYHVGDGPGQIDEYLVAVQKGEEEKAAYLAKSANNVDENTVTATLDPAELGTGKQLYETNCAACHLADGGGTVGPNLTDDYWLHGGSIKNVFSTIKYGVPDKGMKSWKDDFSPKQIASIASYVKSLRGTKPAAPKAPQGDLFMEGGDGAIDSISNKTDPSLDPSGKKENKNDPLMTPSERTP